MVIMGIDPGLKGGISFVESEDYSLVASYATPVITTTFTKNGKKSNRTTMDLPATVELIKTHSPSYAFLEQVAARQGQGVTGMFRFGQNYGEHQGIMSALGITYVTKIPQVWKQHFRLDSNKTASRDKAKEYWPDQYPQYFKLVKQDGLAESALMAVFAIDSFDKLFVD